ncbi:MAG: ABC transporter permease [Deltaproteobacteria bacterium]|nr:ABC transporter permease [Deltaproteobacteria bacterium]
MRALVAIAATTFREAIRDRVLASLFFVAALLLGASLAAEEITIGDQAKVIRGLALGGISLSASVMAMFLGVGLVWRELEQRTIQTVATRPISRTTFVLGKYTGLVVTLAALVAGMLLLYLVLIGTHLGTPHPSLAGYAVLLAVDLMLLTAWATFFSTFAGPTMATVFTLSTFVIGHLADDIHRFGEQAATAGVHGVAGVLYWVLPNFQVLDVQAQAAHEVPVPLDHVLRAGGYGLGYTFLVLLAAVLVFERRDLN